VEPLRSVLYAATTGTAGHVSQEEAEVLFEIAHATARTQADPSFDDLFARAVGSYLMATSLRVPGAADALHFEKWLDEEDEGLSGFLSRMLHRAPRDSAFDVLRSPGEAYENDIAKREAADQALRQDSEQITDSEAAWVIAHLTRDAELTSAQQRLLQSLGAEAPSIAPALRRLVGKPKVAATFGRRP